MYIKLKQMDISVQYFGFGWFISVTISHLHKFVTQPHLIITVIKV